MAIAVQPHVRCPRCKRTRIVTPRQARRVRAGEHNGVCIGCRGVSRTRVRDTDFRFWLTEYGAYPPQGMSSRQFIVAGGAPAELVELARTIWPNP